MIDSTHHIINTSLTVVGATSAAATFVPGNEFRAWSLFTLSAVCSIFYLIINFKHLVLAIRNWNKPDNKETDLPPDKD
jgi:amino acid transporter